MGQFKRDKNETLSCFRCPSLMYPVRDPTGKIWDMLTLRKDRLMAYFTLYVCENCGASQIQRYKIETKKDKGKRRGSS